ncbi:translation elongation factor Ts [Candidatus Microgenomates bacterium]|nr:translation elongation factor Ts [Candidatus Microgenomates bacterium]
MAKIDTKQIKKLREETGAGVMRAKEVLVETKGNYKKAADILKKEGFEKMAKRAGRETTEGRVFTYEHHTGKVGVLVELFSETDFVAKNKLFQNLGKDIALQVASMGDKKVESQDYIKDPSKKISDVIKEVIIKTGENIKLGKVVRVELGK